MSQYLPELSAQVKLQLVENLTHFMIVGQFSLGFIFLTLVIYFLRHLVIRNRAVCQQPTWGGAYCASTPKMQYTASSFIRAYRKLAEPILSVKREKREAEGLYPQYIMQRTHAHDKIETWLIDRPLFLIRKVLKSFVFLQNGNIQAYILYGFIFIGLAILLPSLISAIALIIKFLIHL